MGGDALINENNHLKYYINRDNAMVHYCFKGQFEGKKPFIFGTVSLPLDAKLHEILKEGEMAWEKIFPVGIPPSFEPVRGIIWFAEEGET